MVVNIVRKPMINEYIKMQVGRGRIKNFTVHILLLPKHNRNTLIPPSICHKPQNYTLQHIFKCHNAHP